MIQVLDHYCAAVLCHPLHRAHSFSSIGQVVKHEPRIDEIKSFLPIQPAFADIVMDKLDILSRGDAAVAVFQIFIIDIHTDYMSSLAYNSSHQPSYRARTTSDIDAAHALFQTCIQKCLFCYRLNKVDWISSLAISLSRLPKIYLSDTNF